MPWLDRHRSFQEQLSAYIDGELDARQVAHLEAHLQKCAACRVDLEQLRATATALRDLPEAPLPRTFTLTPERAAMRKPTIPVASLAFGMRIAAAGAAAALAAVVALDLGGVGQEPTVEQPAVMPTSARDAARGEESPAPPPVAEEPAGGETTMGREETLDVDGFRGQLEPGAEESFGDGQARDGTDAPSEDASAPAAVVEEGEGVDLFLVAEIGLGVLLTILVAGGVGLSLATRKR